MTIRARDSYLPDKGYKYFRAGYKLTVGKWIPPMHVLLFASCGQCSQDSVKESPFFSSSDNQIQGCPSREAQIPLQRQTSHGEAERWRDA